MLFLFSFFFFNCFFNNFWCVYSLVSLVYYLCTSLMPPSVFRAYEKFGTCKLCRFPSCLWNGTAYVNFLVQMMQLVHITSCSCIKMDCWKENIYLIAFSTCLWWIFLFFFFFIPLRLQSSTRSAVAYLPWSVYLRKFLFHIVFLLRQSLLVHYNHISKCIACPSLPLISFQILCFQSWR